MSFFKILSDPHELRSCVACDELRSSKASRTEGFTGGEPPPARGVQREAWGPSAQMHASHQDALLLDARGGLHVANVTERHVGSDAHANLTKF